MRELPEFMGVLKDGKYGVPRPAREAACTVSALGESEQLSTAGGMAQLPFYLEPLVPDSKMPTHTQNDRLVKFGHHRKREEKSGPFSFYSQKQVPETTFPKGTQD